MNDDQNLKMNNETSENVVEQKINNQIGIDDLKKVEIKIGEIIKAEKIEKSEKLLVLQVDFNNEVRQIVSGIAEYFLPENLIGKKVAFVTNLKPRELMGYQSNGMILAAKDENKNFSLLEVSTEILNGTKIS